MIRSAKSSGRRWLVPTVVPALLLLTGWARAQEVVLTEHVSDAGVEPATTPVPAMQAAFAPPQPGPAKAIRVVGSVTLPDGKPAAQARVYVSWLTNGSQLRFQQTTADAQGAFRLYTRPDSPPPVPYIGITALVPGRGMYWKESPIQDKRLGNLRIRLEPGREMSGRVIHLDGTPASGTVVRLASIEPSFRFDSNAPPQEFQFLPQAKMLPESSVAALYNARTGPDGGFRIASLPRRGQATVKLEGGLVLAPGSALPIDLGASRDVSAGLLVAVHAGSLKVHLTDRATGKPLPHVPVALMPEHRPASLFSGFAGGMDSVATDAAGVAQATKLVPGVFRVFAAGYVRKVTVEEGKAAGPVEIAARMGPLQGRVLDAAGKPVANVPVALDAPGALPIPEEAQIILAGTIRPVTQTDASGRFQIPEFPWGSDRITLRATRGNDLAVWSGAGASVGKSLELRLKPGALVGVSGRLVDPTRKPIHTQRAAAIRWQPDKPRFAWFTGAKPVQVDPQGRFHIDGLERGESFSLISGSPFGPGPEQEGAGFESPRFVTPTTGINQDLGDVVVHPLEGPQQIVQLYGFDSPDQFNRLLAFLPPPSAQAESEARNAWEQYRAALKSGDLDTARRFTSHASLGWADKREDYLLQSSLRDSGSGPDGAARTLRFVPGISAAYLLTFRLLQENPAGFFNFGAAARALEANPDWVFLAEAAGDRVRMAAILHREEGEWRVVTLPGGRETDDIFLLANRFGGPLDVSDFARPLPALPVEEREAARSAAQRYLTAWAEGDDGMALALTSPLAPGRPRELNALRKLRAQRPDEGVCPIDSHATVELQPVENLTAWEAQWLASYVQAITEFEGRLPTQRNTQDLAGFPANYVHKGAFACFRYAANGRDHLILMLKRGGKWQVLEPAVAL